MKDRLPPRTGPADIREKIRRLRILLDRRGLDAAVIGRADNFAWLTCGGNNRVVRTRENGSGLVIVTKKAVTLVAQTMDGPWLLDQNFRGTDVQYVPLRWYEPTMEAKTAALLKGRKALGDCAIPGIKTDAKAFYDLHYPLTDKEIQRLRWLGRRSEQIIRKIADSVKPGDRESEIANRLMAEYALEGMTCDVLLVGGDQHLAKYRHPTPSDSPVREFLLLHPAVQKWGLHANATRLVSFGRTSPDRLKRYRAACAVQAAALSRCVPGTRFADILEAQKAAYRQTGYAEEWRNHFQGGITGYLLADSTLCMSPREEVKPNMAYDWFSTIRGVKSEELSINTARGVETLSVAGAWPTEDFEADGWVFRLPAILGR